MLHGKMSVLGQSGENWLMQADTQACSPNRKLQIMALIVTIGQKCDIIYIGMKPKRNKDCRELESMTGLGFRHPRSVR